MPEPVPTPEHSHLTDPVKDRIDELLHAITRDPHFRRVVLREEPPPAANLELDIQLTMLALVGQRINEQLVYGEAWDLLRRLMSAVREYHSCIHAQALLEELMELLPVKVTH
jgi:hypothetical protein